MSIICHRYQEWRRDHSVYSCACNGIGCPHEPMAYGRGPVAHDLRHRCRCGHRRGDHFRHDDQCLYSTATESLVCNCDAFEYSDPACTICSWFEEPIQ